MAGGINNIGNLLGKVDSNNALVVALASGSTIPAPIFTGQARLADGTAAAPSLTFASDTADGLYRTPNSMGWTINGTLRGALTASGLTLGTDRSVEWSADPGTATADLVLTRDAANKLAQRNGTNAQEFNPYGYYSSATAFTAGAVKTVTAAVTLSGATTATSNIIPVGAFVIGVATTTTTVITGASGYQVGDGADADRWGDITGTAVGTDSDNTNSTANPTGYFAAASAVTLTAKTSNFTGGVVQVTVFYLTTGAD